MRPYVYRLYEAIFRDSTEKVICAVAVDLSTIVSCIVINYKVC
jgi:hypothetical protein